MERRSYQYRWHTSLVALACAVAGIVIMEIGLLISFGSDAGFPRPSVFAILLLVILAGQFYMMNEEFDTNDLLIPLRLALNIDPQT